MTGAALEQLLDALDVRLDAFAMCEIEKSAGLRCAAADMIVVHFVLEGTGSVECEHGSFSLSPGMVIVVPRNLPKTIVGAGPILKFTDAEADCPLIEGMVKFQTSPGKGELVLGCASVSATIGSGFGLFDSLSEPLTADGTSASLLPIFRMMLEELSRPSVGTRAVVGALMKHVLIVVLREHLSRSGSGTPLFLPMLNPQLGKALTAIILRPHEPHRVEELARLAGMSRSRFAHHFARTYGRAPMDFVQSVRLAAARKLLRGSDLPIKSIAAAVGYASRSHFSRAFRAEFGVDPTRFRSTVDGGLKLEVRGDDLELAAAE